MKKIICVMAAHRREGITLETVKMLKNQSHPPKVLIVGDSNCERVVAKKAGCLYIEHSNRPLGKKWQVGVNHAKTLNPDAVMICGSDSWLSPRWVETAIPHLIDGCDLVGINMFHACKIYPKQKVRIIRRSYQNNRVGIPMGSGRIFSKDILNKSNWNIFPVHKNIGMDFFSFQEVKKHKGRIKIVNSDDMKILTIKSTWTSINSWQTYITSNENKIFPDIKHPRLWLLQHFPGSVEALQRVVKNIIW